MSLIELLSLPFFQRALLVGVVLGLLMALLGVFVILRKMSFFSDAIGHTALTGIALGLLFGFNPFLGAFVTALLVAVVIVIIRTVSKISIDTILGVIFAASVSLGVILLTFTSGYQTDLISFLFGSILTVSWSDVIASLLMLGIVTGVLLIAGKKLTLLTLNPELAASQGVNIVAYELIFLLLLAATIALGIKFVGIILVTALVITPAASAQNLASSMYSMVALTLVLALTAVIGGMAASVFWQIPSGPAIVLTSTLLFFLTLLIRFLRK